MTPEYDPPDSEDSRAVEADRRSSDRMEGTGSVVLHIGETLLEGIVQNRSDEGLFVVTGEPLRIELEVDEGEGCRTRVALVRRTGTLPGGSYGVGLELVLEEPAG